MIMALSIFFHPSTHHLTVLAGFESGHTSIISLNTSPHACWKTTYIAQSHAQPILSLAPSPDKSFYITSSADAILAKHPIISLARSDDDIESVIGSPGGAPLKTLQSKHAGQQGLKIRNDGLVFATAGWDARARVYGCKSMKELAVLKWHTEGCYSISFADVDVAVAAGGAQTEDDAQATSTEVTRRTTTLKKVKDERLRQATMAHWVAVGSKDGKISLWDIY